MKSRVLTLLALVVVLTRCGPRESTDHAAGHPHARAGHHTGGHHDFSDVERFARMFDDPARDEWQRPADVVALLELEPGLRVVDLGAGTGYFLPHLAPAVPGGEVLALDTEPAMVAHMERRIADAGITNVSARVVTPDDPGLEPVSVDRILIVDTWHHIGDRERYAARLREALRPGGFVLVVDFTPQSPYGPPPAMRLPAEQVVRELEVAGLSAHVVDEQLPYQYVVRAARR
jgi:SAM-dependent methyltransferase